MKLMFVVHRDSLSLEVICSATTKLYQSFLRGISAWSTTYALVLLHTSIFCSFKDSVVAEFHDPSSLALIDISLLWNSNGCPYPFNTKIFLG